VYSFFQRFLKKKKKRTARPRIGSDRNLRPCSRTSSTRRRMGLGKCVTAAVVRF
jgi:hypothetical protein